MRALSTHRNQNDGTPDMSQFEHMRYRNGEDESLKMWCSADASDAMELGGVIDTLVRAVASLHVCQAWLVFTFLQCGIIRASHREQPDIFFHQAHQNGRRHVRPSPTRTAAAGQADRVHDAPANVAPKPSLPRPLCHACPRHWSHITRRISRIFKRTPVITTKTQRTRVRGRRRRDQHQCRRPVSRAQRPRGAREQRRCGFDQRDQGLHRRAFHGPECAEQ